MCDGELITCWWHLTFDVGNNFCIFSMTQLAVTWKLLVWFKYLFIHSWLSKHYVTRSET